MYDEASDESLCASRQGYVENGPRCENCQYFDDCSQPGDCGERPRGECVRNPDYTFKVSSEGYCPRFEDGEA